MPKKFNPPTLDTRTKGFSHKVDTSLIAPAAQVPAVFDFTKAEEFVLEYVTGKK